MQHVIENNIWVEDIVDELVIENLRSFEENIVWRNWSDKYLLLV